MQARKYLVLGALGLVVQALALAAPLSMATLFGSSWQFADAVLGYGGSGCSGIGSAACRRRESCRNE